MIRRQDDDDSLLARSLRARIADISHVKRQRRHQIGSYVLGFFGLAVVVFVLIPAWAS